MNQKIETSIATVIITSSGAIGVALLMAYLNSKLSGWSFYAAFIILFINSIAILYVLLSLTEFFKKVSIFKKDIHENRLAKMFFNEFRQLNCVNTFKSIQSDRNNQTFHNAVNGLRQNKNFSELQEPKLEAIRAHFEYWKDWCNYFHRKQCNPLIGKDAFVFERLLDAFSTIVIEYYEESVTKPLETIKEIQKANHQAKIEDEPKERWRDAIRHYDDFYREYNPFVERINNAFSGALSWNINGVPSPPEELR